MVQIKGSVELVYVGLLVQVAGVCLAGGIKIPCGTWHLVLLLKTSVSVSVSASYFECICIHVLTCLASWKQDMHACTRAVVSNKF